ncbi:low molecular weight phosphatase family protein [Lignipirellula cremea]|uniref:Protein ArsC n=1 Tax=Lignipirellula cremea TaxID=2528010 RepID=A0A518DV86_9BACT|nr:protein-tyrosine-phosphatase [Lignipirellula cremea]QDU95752.1 Protein ArsC [Lignipirellula cremea]
MPLTSTLHLYADSRIAEFDRIEDRRRALLQEMSQVLRADWQAGRTLRLVFICTHNSRRSHIAQLWAAVAADYYDVHPVETWSGGSEATAFNPRAVEALRDAGFSIEGDAAQENPRYQVKFGGDKLLECFSKKYDAPPNPSEQFYAIMTCSEADQACPVVLGSLKRFALTYEDPKEADDTPEEADRYKERVAQIGREILYLFSRIVE